MLHFHRRQVPLTVRARFMVSSRSVLLVPRANQFDMSRNHVDAYLKLIKRYTVSHSVQDKMENGI